MQWKKDTIIKSRASNFFWFPTGAIILEGTVYFKARGSYVKKQRQNECGLLPHTSSVEGSSWKKV